MMFAERTEEPQFLKKPDDLEIMEQEDARFETEITGKPAPKVEWYQGDKVLKPSKRVLCEQDGNKYTLVIKETLLKEAGPYSVKATNCLLYTSPSPRDGLLSRMPSSA